jgi:hypothetical protein
VEYPTEDKDIPCFLNKWNFRPIVKLMLWSGSAFLDCRAQLLFSFLDASKI